MLTTHKKVKNKKQKTSSISIRPNFLAYGECVGGEFPKQDFEIINSVIESIAIYSKSYSNIHYL